MRSIYGNAQTHTHAHTHAHARTHTYTHAHTHTQFAQVVVQAAVLAELLQGHRLIKL